MLNDNSSKETVLQILQDAVKQIDQFEVDYDVELSKAVVTRDLSKGDEILKKRATFLIELPERLRGPLSLLNSSIQGRILPDLSFIAATAQDALASPSRVRLVALPMCFISYGDQVGDKNEFEKMVDFVESQS